MALPLKEAAREMCLSPHDLQMLLIGTDIFKVVFIPKLLLRATIYAIYLLKFNIFKRLSLVSVCETLSTYCDHY